MSSSALILMISVWTLVTVITGYFFYKVFTVKKHSEPDSFTENDDEK
jgi:hypothetical protein